MDTTKEYIKMCEKAKEIQKDHEFEYGDLFQDVMGSKAIFIPWEQNIKECPEYYRDCIWLPRQDQIQEMMEIPCTVWRASSLFRKVQKFIMDYKELEPLSMEQIWLCIVMKDLYNKTWNGEDWVIARG